MLSNDLEMALGNAYAKEDAAGRIMNRAGGNEYLKDWFKDEHLIAMGEQTGIITAISLIYSDEVKRSIFDQAERWGYEHEEEMFEYLVSHYKRMAELYATNPLNEDTEWTFDQALEDIRKHVEIMTA